LKQFYLVINLILINLIATAQSGIIKGKVTSADGQPAAFVTIGLKDTKKGTITGEDGFFTLKNIKAGEHVLIISYTGTKTINKNVTVQPDQVTDISVALEATASQLNEIVVAGAHGKTINRKPVSIGKLPVAAMDLPQSVTVIGQKTLGRYPGNFQLPRLRFLQHQYL
jgi:iron complex outermembrane receptor protein